MNAWLITWQWFGNHAKVDDPLVTVFSARKPAKSIAEFVETLYLMTSCTAEGLAYFLNRANKIPYKAVEGEIINGIPHGDRIRCGHNPWIYARKVSKLTIEINKGKGTEIISWQEPPVFKWKDEQRMDIVLDKEGNRMKLERKLATIIKWINQH